MPEPCLSSVPPAARQERIEFFHVQKIQPLGPLDGGSQLSGSSICRHIEERARDSSQRDTLSLRPIGVFENRRVVKSDIRSHMPSCRGGHLGRLRALGNEAPQPGR